MCRRLIYMFLVWRTGGMLCVRIPVIIYYGAVPT